MRLNLDISKIIFLGILFAFLANTFGPVPLAQAQDYRLPAPGVMVHLSPPFNPPILKGIKVHPDNSFRFDFILDKGDVETPLMASLRDESTKLIKYFLVGLTIPEKDLWVNLSPYEKDRIIPQSFGRTEMGRDLLAEDYMLKQITASLVYPEDTIGKRFWTRIYEEAAKRFGTTNIPVNTFNKVWIVPEKAVVFENAKAGTAYVVEAKLKVMLEEDYLSLNRHSEGGRRLTEESKGTLRSFAGAQDDKLHILGSQILREIVIPQLTIEVNENKNFASLRQVYNSLILAIWYKKKIKDSILEQVYADKNKIVGVNMDDPQEKEKIYRRYLKAFKKGVYNYIKEDYDSLRQETMPRKYFSGGAGFEHLEAAMLTTADAAMINEIRPDHLFQVAGGLELAGDAAMTAKNYSFDQVKAEILAAIDADANRLGAERVAQAKKFVEGASPEIQKIILMDRQRNILLFSSHPQFDPDKFKTVTAPMEDIPPELMNKAHNSIPYDAARSQDIQRKDKKPGKNETRVGVAHVEDTGAHAAGGMTAMMEHEIAEETTVHELVGHKLALATRADGTLVLPRWAWIEIAKIIGIEQEADIRNWPEDLRAFATFMRNGHGFSSRSRLWEAVAYAVEDQPTSRYNLTAQNIKDIRGVLSQTLFLLDDPVLVFDRLSIYKGMGFNGKKWKPYYLGKTNEGRSYSVMTQAKLTDFLEGKILNTHLAEVNFNMLKDYYGQMIDEGIPLRKERYHLMLEVDPTMNRIVKVHAMAKGAAFLKGKDTVLFPVIVDEDGTWLVQRGTRDYPNLAFAVRTLNLMLREGDPIANRSLERLQNFFGINFKFPPEIKFILSVRKSTDVVIDISPAGGRLPSAKDLTYVRIKRLEDGTLLGTENEGPHVRQALALYNYHISLEREKEREKEHEGKKAKEIMLKKNVDALVSLVEEYLAQHEAQHELERFDIPISEKVFFDQKSQQIVSAADRPTVRTFGRFFSEDLFLLTGRESPVALKEALNAYNKVIPQRVQENLTRLREGLTAIDAESIHGGSKVCKINANLEDGVILSASINFKDVDQTATVTGPLLKQTTFFLEIGTIGNLVLGKGIAIPAEIKMAIHLWNRQRHEKVKNEEVKRTPIVRPATVIKGGGEVPTDVLPNDERAGGEESSAATVSLKKGSEMLDGEPTASNSLTSTETVGPSEGEPTVSDPAMRAPVAKGGIDLTPETLHLQTQGQGVKFNIPSNAAEWRNMKIEGFTPVIFSITPINNLPFFLGISKDKKI